MKEDMIKQIQLSRFTIKAVVFVGLLFSSAQPVYAEEISPEAKQETSRLQSRFSDFYNKLKHFSRCVRGKEQCSPKEKNVLRAGVGAAGFLLFLGLTTIGYRLTIRMAIADKGKYIENKLRRLQLQFNAAKQLLKAKAGIVFDSNTLQGMAAINIEHSLVTIPDLLQAAKDMDNENLKAKNKKFDEIVEMIHDIEGNLDVIREYAEKSKKQ